MFKEYTVNGKLVQCKDVPYYNGNGEYSVVVYYDDEYIGQIEKTSIHSRNFEQKLTKFVIENV